MAWAPDDYANLAQLKNRLRITNTDWDAELTVMLAAACREVDRATGRQFGIVEGSAETRYYRPFWDRHFNDGAGAYVVVIDDLMTTTDLVITSDGSAVSSDDYTLHPRNAAAKGKPWTEIELDEAPAAEIDIAAFWGWSSVPAGATEGTLLESARLNKRRDSPFGVAGSPDTGSEVRLLAKLDVDAKKVLGPLTRWWAAK